jgi:uncharacterized protein YceH (UPF0502 family)
MMHGAQFVRLDRLAARKDRPLIVRMPGRFRKPGVQRDAVAALLVGERNRCRPPAALADRAGVDAADRPALFVLVGLQRFRAFDVGPGSLQ